MITTFALLLICIFSYYLIICEFYDDGVIGRIALAVLSFSGGVGFAQSFAGAIKFDPVSQSIFLAIALFEGRHIYRVYRAKLRETQWKNAHRRIAQ